MSLSATEHKVVSLLASRRSELVQDLAAWVAVPSQSGYATGLDTMRELLIARLRKLGATCELVPGDAAPLWLREGAASPGVAPPTLLARRWQSPGSRRVLLCGHIDTVHDHRGPFRELVIASDGMRAIGPGCADMKGGLLVAIAALEALDACGVSVPWGFAINSDEETGSFHSDRTLRQEAASGYVCGLVFEPAMPDGGLVVERPGSGQFMIECRGQAAHVGRDFAKGVSAVRALAEACTRTIDLADVARGILVNIGPLEGGPATNIVPDRALAWGNVRCFSASAEQAAREGLRSIEQRREQLPTTAVELIMNRPAKPRTPEVEHLALAARSAALDLGQELPFGVTGGVCDGNNLQAAGLPVIDTLGVHGGGLHTTDEWIELDSLVHRAQLAALLIMRLAQPSSNHTTH
jgi:glutamate carboxypeptidase